MNRSARERWPNNPNDAGRRRRLSLGDRDGPYRILSLVVAARLSDKRPERENLQRSGHSEKSEGQEAETWVGVAMPAGSSGRRGAASPPPSTGPDAASGVTSADRAAVSSPSVVRTVECGFLGHLRPQRFRNFWRPYHHRLPRIRRPRSAVACCNSPEIPHCSRWDVAACGPCGRYSVSLPSPSTGR